MGDGRFDHGRADELSRGTYPPHGPAPDRTPPRIFFTVDPEIQTRMTASPPGASILCLMVDGEDASIVRITTAQHEHIADITVRCGASQVDLTEETIAIASAIYWSWWRAKDMRGEHTVEWSGCFRGPDNEPRETGWCDLCGDVYDRDERGHRAPTSLGEKAGG